MHRVRSCFSYEIITLEELATKHDIHGLKNQMDKINANMDKVNANMGMMNTNMGMMNTKMDVQTEEIKGVTNAINNLPKELGKFFRPIPPRQQVAQETPENRRVQTKAIEPSRYFPQHRVKPDNASSLEESQVLFGTDPDYHALETPLGKPKKESSLIKAPLKKPHSLYNTRTPNDMRELRSNDNGSEEELKGEHASKISEPKSVGSSGKSIGLERSTCHLPPIAHFPQKLITRRKYLEQKTRSDIHNLQPASKKP